MVSGRSWRLTSMAPLALALTVCAATVDRFAPGAPASRMMLHRAASHRFGVVGAAAYPRHAVGVDGVRVDLRRPVRRIASQEWSLDEYVYSLVPAERVIGVSQAAFDARFSNVSDIAARLRPAIAADVEAVVTMNPDLAIVSSTARADYTELLRAAGVVVYRAYTTPASLAEIEEQIGILGYLVADDAAVAAARSAFHDAIASAALRRRAGNAPRVLALNGHYAYGSRTVLDDVLRVLGATNVAAAAGLEGYAPMASEEILRASPDWIVTGAPAGTEDDARARLLADVSLAATDAGRTGRVVVVDQRVFTALSPFTARLLEALGDALYGRQS
jgi:ABC-type hemin transport system substrate-binding protein